jgi:hypothetical protein
MINFTKLPAPCRDIGCYGASCKWYKAVEGFPYYKCMKVAKKQDEEEDSDDD